MNLFTLLLAHPARVLSGTWASKFLIRPSIISLYKKKKNYIFLSLERYIYILGHVIAFSYPLSTRISSAYRMLHTRALHETLQNTSQSLEVADILARQHKAKNLAQTQHKGKIGLQPMSTISKPPSSSESSGDEAAP